MKTNIKTISLIQQKEKIIMIWLAFNPETDVIGTKITC